MLTLVPAAAGMATPCRTIAASWDTVPLFAHIRTANFTAADVAALRHLQAVTVQGTAFAGMGSEEQAAYVRGLLPAVPVLAYRSVYYSEPFDDTRAALRADPGKVLRGADGEPLVLADGKAVYNMSQPGVAALYTGAIAALASRGQADGAFGDSGCGRAPKWLPPAEQQSFAAGQWAAAASAQRELQPCGGAFVSNCPYLPPGDSWPPGVRGVMFDSWCSDFQTGDGGGGAALNCRDEILRLLSGPAAWRNGSVVQARYYLSGHNGEDPRFGAIAFLVAAFDGALFGASTGWDWAGDWSRQSRAPWASQPLGAPGVPVMLDEHGCGWNRSFASGASVFVNLCSGPGHPHQAHAVWADGTTWPARLGRRGAAAALAAHAAAAGPRPPLPAATVLRRAAALHECEAGRELGVLGPDGRARCLSHRSADGDTARVRQRLLEQLTPVSSATIATAHKWAASLLPTGVWGDVDYNSSQDRVNWPAEEHMVRVVEMGAAWRTANGTAALRSATLRALDGWLDRDLQDANWWFNQIAIPLAVSKTLILLGELPANTTAGCLRIVARANYSRWTGANLVDMVKIHITAGAAEGDRAGVAAAFAAGWGELRVAHQPDDDIQVDRSFHQHSGSGRGMLLTGSYGGVFTEDALSLIGLANGTGFAPDPAQLALLVDLVLDGQRWMAVGTPGQLTWDWSVYGRENSRPGTHRFPMGWAQQLRSLPSPRKDELDAFARAIEGETQRGDAPLVGNRHFFDSDYMMHRRRSWAASIRMYSNRTIAARCTNEEGKLNSHSADGVTNLWLDGSEYDEIAPVWNWTQLAGMSAPAGARLLPCSYSWPDQQPGLPFVGGVSDGTSGAAFFEIPWHNTSFVSRGATFFGDSGWVHVAVPRCADPRSSVSTALAQHIAPAGSRVYFAKGGAPAAPIEVHPGAHTLDQSTAWVFHRRGASRGTAYIPLGHMHRPLVLSLANLTGDWSQVGMAKGAVRRPVFGLTMPGSCEAGPVAYAVVSDTTLEQLPAKTAALTSASFAVGGWGAVAQPDPDAPTVQAVFWQEGGGHSPSGRRRTRLAAGGVGPVRRHRVGAGSHAAERHGGLAPRDGQPHRHRRPEARGTQLHSAARWPVRHRFRAARGRREGEECHRYVRRVAIDILSRCPNYNFY